MATIEELIKGVDNEIGGAMVRKATYRGRSEILSRPIQNLFPLGIQHQTTVEKRMNGKKKQEQNDDRE